MLLGVALAGLLIVAALGLAGAIAFGGPTPPPRLLSIRDAVLKRDRTDLPKPTFFAARDQTTFGISRLSSRCRTSPGRRCINPRLGG
jgi:hypothetical protein